MKFGFIAKHRSVWPVAWLGVSRSGFHAWLKRSRCARSREDDANMPAVRASFVASDRTYGARRIWRDVLEAGFSCGLHKIERLMRAQALRVRPRRRPAQRRRRTFRRGDRAERSGSPVHGGPAQPQMDCRLHLYLGDRGLAGLVTLPTKERDGPAVLEISSTRDCLAPRAHRRGAESAMR
jgi:putative transposase